MYLILLNCQGLEFVIVPRGLGGAFGGYRGTLSVRFGTFPSARPIAVGQLRYREDSLGMAFRPLLAGHCAKQAQIVSFYCEATTPRLEVADGTMSVQNERRRLPTAAGRSDRFDDLAGPGNVVLNLQSFAAVFLAVDQCSGVCEYPGSLQQCKCTETHD